MELVPQPGTSTQEANVKECFRILCPTAGRILHCLPILPDEVVLFQERKKMKEKEKSIESLTQEIIQTLTIRASSTSTVNFNVKSLAEELGDDVKRLYDICNVFEALGVVIKKKVNTFCWIGIHGGLMNETLRHLKSIAESENLHRLILNKEVVTENKEILKLNLQVLTEKMMMLFLLLNTHEFLTKSQLYSFLYRGADENRSSAVLRISKVLKIVQTLGLISADWIYGEIEGNKMSTLQRFRYTGPAVTSVEDQDENHLVAIRDQALASTPDQENPSPSHPLDHSYSHSQRVSPVKITYEIIMLDDIEERIVDDDDPRGAVDVEFIGDEGLGNIIIGRKDMTVKDEILED